ncbi:MAG: exodeoxyribonuclease V subunit beta [Nitriliruptoraceae bacterium]
MTAAFAADGVLPTTSLALEASAGTGKTWTLTSLTVRYVAELGVELPELLLVTFTRAATAELRDRVRRRLAEAAATIEDRLAAGAAWELTGDVVLDHLVTSAAAAPDTTVELQLRADRLRQAATQLDEATISTIHGFCQTMLRHAALEAGVEFDAVLLEDDADLLGELVDDHLARELRPADPAWVRYLQAVGGVDRDRLADLAREVAGLPTLQLSPQVDDPAAGDLAPWYAALERFTALWQDGGRDRALTLFGELKQAGAFENPRQATYTDTKAATRVPELDAWLAAPPPIPPVLARTKPTELHHADNPPFSLFTSRGIGTKLVDGWPIGDQPLVAAADQLLAAVSAPATRFLHRAATTFWTELDQRKRQRTVLTFDDLLRRLAAALEDPSTREAVLAAIRQRYRVALIDEFQDTDPVQWRIFSALFARTDPFVLIGDPKQAIYGFRGADVHTYVRARDTRPAHATLATNHRSDAAFVTACNHLFGQPGAFATPAIPYHAIAARHGDRLVDPSGRAALQVRLLTRDAGQLSSRGTPPQLVKSWADRALPRDVADVAAGLLAGGARIEGAPLTPRDLAVLVRTNRRALAVQQALTRAGIPAVIQRGGSVFETEEAEAVQRLLTAMLRPSAQRPAVAAAATRLFGRDAATLAAQLEAADPGPLDAAGAAAAAAAGWDAWVAALTRWGECWQRDGVLAAIQLAMEEEAVATRLLGSEDGDRRLTNLRHLLELLHTEEVASGAAGHVLADWLAARRADAADGVPAGTVTELRLEADAEAVRVVTIHGSKGLQYPVVLCPDLWDGKRKGSDTLLRFHDPEVTELDRAITLDLEVDEHDPRRQRNLALARWEGRTEQLRLAYVALTRAQHRAVVWWGPLSDSQDAALASLLHGHAVEGTDPERDPAGHLDTAAARVRAADDDQLLADVTALAGRAEGSIGVEVVSGIAAAPRWEAPEAVLPQLEARPATRRLDRRWRRTSFSGLVRDAHPTGGTPGPGALGSEEGDGDGRDVDAEVEPVDAAQDPAPTAAPASEPEVPLGRFPRGPGPGTFLHDVLEHLDLTQADDDGELLPLLARMEARHGIDPEHREAVARGLRLSVASPLGPEVDGLRLAALSRGDRLDELRFELPVAAGMGASRAAVHLGAVADLLASSEDPVLVAAGDRLRDPALAAGFRGYLNGSIDLLARLPDGRVIVADYKSNWFGDRATGRSVAADYRPERLVEAMLDHHYVLQALLYLVAAHRYLRWRLPGYDPDRHLVGAGYLFLRGMVGADGAGSGILWVRPGGDLIVELSRLLDRGVR